MTRKSKKSNSDKAADLRLRAEDKAKGAETEIQESLSPDDARRVFHELRVHQIELEMQNEELRRTQVELEAAWVRYFDLYDLAPVGYFTFSEQGLILQANLTAATLLGVARGDLVKLPVSRFILREDQDTFYRHRRKLFETGKPQACELRLVRKKSKLCLGFQLSRSRPRSLEATAANRFFGTWTFAPAISTSPHTTSFRSSVA